MNLLSLTFSVGFLGKLLVNALYGNYIYDAFVSGGYQNVQKSNDFVEFISVHAFQSLIEE